MAPLRYEAVPAGTTAAIALPRRCSSAAALAAAFGILFVPWLVLSLARQPVPGSLQDQDSLQSLAQAQHRSRFQPGQAVRLYAVGSSNTVWVTWLEELHLLLRRQGYKLPLVPGSEAALTGLDGAPTCDDSAEYLSAQTTRIGKPGWASWNFAFEGNEGCNAEGFRNIAGFMVSCRTKWGCPAKSPEPLRLSRISEDAAHSDITILSCWINDSKQFATDNACYNHSDVSRVATASISIENLRHMIRSIHKRNAHVLVVVLALYPDVRVPPRIVDTETLPIINEINKKVKEALQHEPGTLFADYPFPLEIDLFQRKHFGHPNCRAAKLMANGIVDELIRARVLAAGVDQVPAEGCNVTAKKGMDSCARLSPACCQRSPICRQSNGNSCIPFAPEA